jgi:hypothetical protein
MFKFKLSAIFHTTLLVGLMSIFSCKESAPEDKAQSIIDAAIKAHGSKIFDHSTVQFKFRDRNYKSVRSDGKYVYSRFWDSLGTVIHDELSNTGFIRHVGQTMVNLDSKKITAYTNSVNGVFYFFALPFNLNDPAVIKEYLGEVTLLDKKYDKIKVSFKQNEADRMIHDDTYVYWFNKEDHLLDYLAYDYTEPDEKGLRFRQAINRRKINGLVVQDYINFKPKNDSIPIPVERLDEAWAGNQLQELSKIINELVKVTKK